MAQKGFRQMLKERQIRSGSLLCVGLDPRPEKMPSCISRGEEWSRVLIWMREIVDATASYACMFKPQKAHYEAIRDGQKTLQGVVDYIHCKYPDIPVFLDCKRGDIDRTQQRYRIAHFEIDGVDGMNFSPYMGKECMSNLVDTDHLERAIVGLCYTSNKSAREVQDVILADGRPYWQFMAEKILKWAKELGIVDNAGLVMAAAYEKVKGSGEVYSKFLFQCRQIVGDNLWFLIPGVGAQGGFVEATVQAAFAGFGSIAINSSSGISEKSSDKDFAEAAAAEAERLANLMTTVYIVEQTLPPTREALDFSDTYRPLCQDEIMDIFARMGAIYDDDHFVYTKGGHGKAYANKDDIYADPDKLSLLCKEIAYRSKDLKIQVVAGPAFGGGLIANRVAEWLRRFTGDDKIVAVVADADGDAKVIKRSYPKRIINKRVLVVEDIINTGGSAAGTVKAVTAVGGNVIACKALANRAADKKAAAELIGVPFESLVELEMDNYSPDSCPYCAEDRPINQELGHGRAFLVELIKVNSIKANRLGFSN